MSPGNNITCCSRDKKEIKCEHQVVLFNSDNSLARQGLFPFLQEKKLILTVVQKPVHNHTTSELCRSQVWLQSLCSCPSAHCCLLCSLLSYSLLELNYEQDSGWGTILGNTSAWKRGWLLTVQHIKLGWRWGPAWFCQGLGASILALFSGTLVPPCSPLQGCGSGKMLGMNCPAASVLDARAILTQVLDSAPHGRRKHFFSQGWLLLGDAVQSFSKCALILRLYSVFSKGSILWNNQKHTGHSVCYTPSWILNTKRFWILHLVLNSACFIRKVRVKVAQLCQALCNPMDCAVHRILQARIMEWVTFPFSRGSSQHRDQIQVSHIAGRFFTSWITRETQEYWNG